MNMKHDPIQKVLDLIDFRLELEGVAEEDFSDGGSITLNIYYSDLKERGLQFDTVGSVLTKLMMDERLANFIYPDHKNLSLSDLDVQSGERPYNMFELTLTKHFFQGKNEIPLKTGGLVLDGTFIKFGDRLCNLSKSTKLLDLARFIFSRDPEEYVSWDEIYEAITGNSPVGGKSKSQYNDWVDNLNKKIRQEIGTTDNFLKRKNKHLARLY